MSIEKLMTIIQRLRGPDGCPWDREQTLETLKPYLVDEAHEVFAAINALDGDNLTEELGDLLFHVLLLCRVAAEEGEITIDAVTRSIEEKMIRRHPHVFGEEKVEGVADVLRNWEEIKRREKKEKGECTAGPLVPDLLRHLPALRRAQRIQEKAAGSGFDWPDVTGVIAKIREELEEIEAEIAGGDHSRRQAELGDLLFAVVNLARHLKLDAELSLQKMINRWTGRFRKMEKTIREQGKCMEKMTLEELDAIWDEVK